MTKTVKQIVDEYKNRLNQARIEEMILKVGSETLIFKNVVNFKVINNGDLSFDYNDVESYFEQGSTEIKHRNHWKHVVCKGELLLMQGAIGEGF